MRKTITIIKQDQKDVADIFKNGIKTEMLFRELQRDTIGKSGSNPTWGYVYSKNNGKLKYEGVALHKEYDYDFPFAAYAEKVWSILGKELLEKGIRVPNIDIVEPSPGYEEIISYRLMDNGKEDMIHLKDTLFNKFEREEIKAKRDIYTLDELLECIKLQIQDEQNYANIEKDIINVLLLDAVTNNGDRHAFNWGLVRDKDTNEYSLAVFDHSSAFVNMFEDREFFVRNGWNTTYITVGNDRGRNKIGSSGETVVRYISTQYPEYFKEFADKLDKKLPEIIEIIKNEKMKIDFNRLSKKLGEKRQFLIKLRDREELEHE